MQFVRNCGSAVLGRFYSTTPTAIFPKNVTWLKKWGRRDYKRRKIVREYAGVRMRLRMLKKTNFLPDIVKEAAAKDLHELPRDSSYIRVRNRCIMTDRPRGVLFITRMCRHKFRKYADLAQLPGIKRAMW